MVHACIICDKVYIRKSFYDKHIKACETARDSKIKCNFRCIACSKTYVYKRAYEKHMLICEKMLNAKIKNNNDSNAESEPVFNFSDSYFRDDNFVFDAEINLNSLTECRTWLDELDDFSLKFSNKSSSNSSK